MSFKNYVSIYSHTHTHANNKITVFLKYMKPSSVVSHVLSDILQTAVLKRLDATVCIIDLTLPTKKKKK